MRSEALSTEQKSDFEAPVDTTTTRPMFFGFFAKRAQRCEAKTSYKLTEFEAENNCCGLKSES